MPRTVLSLIFFCNPSPAQVVESTEIPPLPVSSTKFNESLKLSNVARTITIPPVKIVNGTEAICFAGGGINSSWAIARNSVNKKVIMYPATKAMMELLLRRTLELFVLQSADKNEDTQPINMLQTFNTDI